MEPFTVETTIARPRAAVFGYLADIANHPEFTDHFLREWRMTREETHGVGAGGRFRAKLPFIRFPWGDWTIAEAREPARLVLTGRTGKFNRIRTLAVWDLREAAGGATRIEFTFRSEPRFPSDRLLDALSRGAMKRGWRRSLRRLRLILEEGRARGARATIAGGPRKPATGLRS